MDENVDSSAISLQSAEYVRKRRRGIYLWLPNLDTYPHNQQPASTDNMTGRVRRVIEVPILEQHHLKDDHILIHIAG
jgi:prolyl-tRNA synthetase